MATDKTQYALIKVTGVDAEKFLQGQLTCDVTLCNSKPFIFGAHCNRQGRMLSFFRLFKQDESFYLCMPKDVIDSALAALNKYALFSKVQLEVVACNDITKLPFSVSHHEDVINGIPRLYPNTIAEFLPHYLNLVELDAVSFTKGCYTGQEIIARMHHRGKIKQHLYFVSTDKSFSPGDKIIIDEKTIGTCVDVIQQEKIYLFLATVADKIADDTSNVTPVSYAETKSHRE